MTRSPVFDRRSLLLSAGMLAAAPSLALSRTQGWYDILDDAGRPVASTRLPVELVAEIERLPTLIRMGSASPAAILYEFFDYNCPICRAAAPDLEKLAGELDDIALVLVNNPILSPGSREAAGVESAVLASGGQDAARRFHAAMFSRPGPASRVKALDVAQSVGLSRADIETRAAETATARGVDAAARLAASLGFSVTPSFVAGPAGIIGYPGPAAMKRIAGAVLSCGEPACR